MVLTYSASFGEIYFCAMLQASALAVAGVQVPCSSWLAWPIRSTTFFMSAAS